MRGGTPQAWSLSRRRRACGGLVTARVPLEVNAAILLYYQTESDDESSDEDWTEEMYMYREMSRSIFDLF